MDRRLPERTAWSRHVPVVMGAALWIAHGALAMDPESRPVPLAASGGMQAGASMVVPVLVTVLALGVSAWLWLGRRSRMQRRPEGCISVLDRAGMGRGRALALVRVGDRVVLVGESSQGFQRLAEFDAADPAVRTLEARRLAS